jgi:beta-lactamase class D
MKKIILCLSAGFLAMLPTLAEANCLLIKEKDKVIVQEGECQTQYAPNSTFKIPLSVMGYDAGVLVDEIHPVLPYKKGYNAYLVNCEQSQTPLSWMRNSCVWYSQQITQQLGVEKFKNYMTNFNYGNKDISGDPGKNNGLTDSWLDSSIKISPVEQTVFIQKIIDKKLGVSENAYVRTQNISFIENLANNWTLYGKTGMGTEWNQAKNQKLQRGWFVGWIQQAGTGRTMTLATYVRDTDRDGKPTVPASWRARDAAKERLKEIIQADAAKPAAGKTAGG